MADTTRPPAREVENIAEANPAQDMVVTERAGMIAFALGRGAQLSNHDIQAMTGLGPSGAWLMMGRLSRVLPLTFSGYGGTWHVMTGADGFEGDPPMR